MWTLALPPSHGVTNACPKSLPVLAHAYGSTEVLATCRLILAYGLVFKKVQLGCHVSSDSIVLLLEIDSNSINRKEECWCLIKWKGQPTWRSVGPQLGLLIKLWFADRYHDVHTWQHRSKRLFPRLFFGPDFLYFSVYFDLYAWLTSYN